MLSIIFLLMAADFVVKILSCVLLAFSWWRTPVRPLARHTDRAAELPSPERKRLYNWIFYKHPFVCTTFLWK